jgi:hypothetical protein
LARDVNITIRCNQETKELFNIIAKDNPQFSKSELFEAMIKSYLGIQALQEGKINEILELSKLNYEYLVLLIKCNESVPTNVSDLINVLEQPARFDKFIRTKLRKG